MRYLSNLWALALVACLSVVSVTVAEVVHTKTYFSGPFELGSGDVFDKYKTLEMPQGHIGLRNFFAEVVDEEGNSVPLFEVYMHHWLVVKLYVKKGHKELVSSTPKKLTDSTVEFTMHKGHVHRMQFQEGADVKQEARQGTCSDDFDATLFGVGSETRHTDFSFPAPYATESGNPAAIPEGYEEAWYLNVHAIDTRGVVDTTSCLECLCEAYGVTTDSSGRPLEPGYIGGISCCYDETHCAVKENATLPSRKLYLKYVVTWVEWDESTIPVRSYFLDATDPRTSLYEEPDCKVEYDVTECNEESSSACIDRHRSIAALPVGGELIQATLHQHTGGMGGILYDKNGVVLCESLPIYGDGDEAGNEAGYVVGMTTCSPKPGSIYLDPWKEFTFDAFYSAEQSRTGVMSIFSLHVADPVQYVQEVTK